MSRLIAVGVRDAEASRAALVWAATEAAGDGSELHVLHCYELLALDGSSWAPVVQANDALRAGARHIVNESEHVARSSAPGVEISGSAVRGAVGAALTDLSRLVDLVVVGESARNPLRDQLAATVRCPLVVVPDTDVSADDPIVVAVDRHDLPLDALHFALRTARRWGAQLVVAASDGLPTSGAEAVADVHARLDMQLESVTCEYPDVPVEVTLHSTDFATVVRTAAIGARLLVLPCRQGAPDRPFLCGSAWPLAAPVAIVPVRRRATSTAATIGPFNLEEAAVSSISGPR